METARLDVSHAPPAIAEAIERVRQGGARFVATRDGLPVAALISLAELALFEELLADLSLDLDVAALQAALAEQVRSATHVVRPRARPR